MSIISAPPFPSLRQCRSAHPSRLPKIHTAIPAFATLNYHSRSTFPQNSPKNQFFLKFSLEIFCQNDFLFYFCTR